MLARQSEFLLACKPELQKLISLLKPHFDYVSVLATDVTGTSVMASQRQKAIRDYSDGERGFVVRVPAAGFRDADAAFEAPGEAGADRAHPPPEPGAQAVPVADGEGHGPAGARIRGARSDERLHRPADGGVDAAQNPAGQGIIENGEDEDMIYDYALKTGKGGELNLSD